MTVAYEYTTEPLLVCEDRRVASAEDLIVYRKAYEQAMEIFRLSLRFPPEERYALTGQSRRSSRSVCANMKEAWAKRRYEAHFLNKLTDCDGENGETKTHLDFAKDCGYITEEEHNALITRNREIGRMLGAMINNPTPFLLK